MLKELERLTAKLRNRSRSSQDCQGLKSITKRQTKREIERRRRIYDATRPHHGDDLIEALEFENFVRDDYRKESNEYTGTDRKSIQHGDRRTNTTRTSRSVSQASRTENKDN